MCLRQNRWNRKSAHWESPRWGSRYHRRNCNHWRNWPIRRGRSQQSHSQKSHFQKSQLQQETLQTGVLRACAATRSEAHPRNRCVSCCRTFLFTCCCPSSLVKRALVCESTSLPSGTCSGSHCFTPIIMRPCSNVAPVSSCHQKGDRNAVKAP